MGLNDLLIAANIKQYKSDINDNLRSGLLFAYKRKLINKIYNDDDYETNNIDQIFLPYNNEGIADLDPYNDNDTVIALSVRHLGEKQSEEVAKEFIKELKSLSWKITDIYHEDGCLVLMVDWGDKD